MGWIIQPAFWEREKIVAGVTNAGSAWLSLCRRSGYEYARK